MKDNLKDEFGADFEDTMEPLEHVKSAPKNSASPAVELSEPQLIGAPAHTLFSDSMDLKGESRRKKVRHLLSLLVVQCLR